VCCLKELPSSCPIVLSPPLHCSLPRTFFVCSDMMECYFVYMCRQIMLTARVFLTKNKAKGSDVWMATMPTYVFWTVTCFARATIQIFLIITRRELRFSCLASLNYWRRFRFYYLLANFHLDTFKFTCLYTDWHFTDWHFYSYINIIFLSEMKSFIKFTSLIQKTAYAKHQVFAMHSPHT
jgi:hypothetical protein